MAPRLSHTACYLQPSRCLLGESTLVAATAVLVGRQPPATLTASFSTTRPVDARSGPTKITKQRRAMFTWLQKQSSRLEFLPERIMHQKAHPDQYSLSSKKNTGDRDADESKEGSSRKKELFKAPQYVGISQRQPFPMNKLFMSEAVLDDASRELIHRKIMQDHHPIKMVSAQYGVDIRRVAAVVRLKEVEKQWVKEGKKLATEYAHAITSMLPISRLDGARSPHESVNDVHVHRYTMQQLFLPVSESKHFTREHAARAFHKDLLPADKRIPIPELIRYEKDRLEGRSLRDSLHRMVTDTAAMELKMANRIRAREEREASKVTKVESDRFQFRFQNFEVEDVGKDGRSKKGTGWRYGVPLYDRQRGHSREVPEKVGI